MKLSKIFDYLLTKVLRMNRGILDYFCINVSRACYYDCLFSREAQQAHTIDTVECDQQCLKVLLI